MNRSNIKIKKRLQREDAAFQEEYLGKKLDFVQSLREITDNDGKQYFGNKWLIEKFLERKAS